MSPSQLRQLLLANAYKQQRMAVEEPFAKPVPDTKRGRYRWKPSHASASRACSPTSGKPMPNGRRNAVLTMANLPNDDRVLKRSPENYITIYALTEPDTGEIRYVGKTEKPPAVRLREHSKLPVNDDMLYWIRGLEARGTGPNMEIITCCGQQWWEGEETFWIRWCRHHGGNLFNRDPGGVCRDEHGRPNLTGHVKNYIGRKFYGRALVYDRDAERRRASAKSRKGNKGAQKPKWRQEVSTFPTLPPPRRYVTDPTLLRVGDAGFVFKRTTKEKLDQVGKKTCQVDVPKW